MSKIYHTERQRLYGSTLINFIIFAAGYTGAVMAESSSLPAAVPCQICGAPEAQLPHMNCANIGERELSPRMKIIPVAA